MLKFEDYENTYWCRKGKYQKEYDEMQKAIDNGKFRLTKTSEILFNRYYRFYNDGDTPSQYRYDEKAYVKELEKRVNDRMIREYKRFKKLQEVQ